MTVEYVKARVDLLDVIEQSGIELHGRPTQNFRIICPFHNDIRPSLVVQPQEQWWYCYGCRRRGDVVQWVVYRDGCSFTEALAKLRQGKLRAPIILKKIEHPDQYVTSPIPNAIIEHYCHTLQQYPKVREYLVDVRHWSPEILESYRIGYDDGEKRITIPIPDLFDGSWIDVRLYRPGANRPHYEPKMKAYEKRRPAMPFDVGGMENADWCIVVEGEPDALAAASIGVPAVTNTCGASSAVRIWRTWGGLVCAEHLGICFDDDAAGKKAAQDLQQYFPDATIITMPQMHEKGDITDMITHFGAETTQNFLWEQTHAGTVPQRQDTDDTYLPRA